VCAFSRPLPHPRRPFTFVSLALSLSPCTPFLAGSPQAIVAGTLSRSTATSSLGATLPTGGLANGRARPTSPDADTAPPPTATTTTAAAATGGVTLGTAVRPRDSRVVRIRRKAAWDSSAPGPPDPRGTGGSVAPARAATPSTGSSGSGSGSGSGGGGGGAAIAVAVAAATYGFAPGASGRLPPPPTPGPGGTVCRVPVLSMHV
jgi:hypothetical protein